MEFKSMLLPRLNAFEKLREINAVYPLEGYQIRHLYIARPKLYHGVPAAGNNAPEQLHFTHKLFLGKTLF